MAGEKFFDSEIESVFGCGLMRCLQSSAWVFWNLFNWVTIRGAFLNPKKFAQSSAQKNVKRVC